MGPRFAYLAGLLSMINPFRGLAPRIALLCLMSRGAFAAILLPWFLIGGLTKVGGLVHVHRAPL